MVKGVCAFDLDQTFTCQNGDCSQSKLQSMKSAINHCKTNDMGVVINTARPPQADVKHSVPTTVRNLLKGVPVYTRKRSCRNSVPEEKLKNMRRIARRYNVPLKNTILVDDLLETCNTLNNNGAIGIHVHREDGMTNYEFKALKKFVDKI